jgi:hypothetical protein
MAAQDAVDQELHFDDTHEEGGKMTLNKTLSLVKASLSFINKASAKAKKRTVCGKIKSEWARECRNMHASSSFDPRKVKGVMCQINLDADSDHGNTLPQSPTQRINSDINLISSDGATEGSR